MSEFGAIFTDSLSKILQKRPRLRFKVDPDFYLGLIKDFGEDATHDKEQTD